MSWETGPLGLLYVIGLYLGCFAALFLIGVAILWAGFGIHTMCKFLKGDKK